MFKSKISVSTHFGKYLYFILICVGMRLREHQVFEEKNDPVIMADFDNVIDLKHKLEELVELKRNVTEGMAIFPFLWITQMFYEIIFTLFHFTFNSFYPASLLMENGLVLAYNFIFIYYIESKASRKKRFSELLDLIPLPNHDPDHMIDEYPKFIYNFNSIRTTLEEYNSIDYQIRHDCKIGVSLLIRYIMTATIFYAFVSYMYF